MRLVLITLALACLPALAQDRPLSGFRYVFVVDPVYSEGTDIYGFGARLREQLERGDEWTVVEDVEGVATDRQILSEMLVATIVDYTMTFNITNSVTIEFRDILNSPVFTATARGTSIGSDPSQDVRNAIRNAVQDLNEARGKYDPAATRNVMQLLPDVSYFRMDEADLDQYLSSNDVSQIEGIWSDPGQIYSLGIVRDTARAKNEYVIFVLDSDFALWAPGMVRGTLRETAEPGVYLADIRNGLHQPMRLTAFSNGGVLELEGEGLEFASLIKLFPSQAAERRGSSVLSSSQPTYLSSGTCFAVRADGTVLTNYHVVSSANAIRIRWSNGIVTDGDVQTFDPANDIAVLRAASPPPAVLPLASSRGVRLGQDVFTIGFPVTQILGSDPKYTNGTISSLTGPTGVPTYMQISVPIQPGNSGGPLVTATGEVVGIVTATAALPAFVENAGALPQNVNWAVKADYASLLLDSLPSTEPVASLEEAVSRTEAAVCAVETAR